MLTQTYLADRQTNVPKEFKGARGNTTEVACQITLELSHENLGNGGPTDTLPPVHAQVSVTTRGQRVL